MDNNATASLQRGHNEQVLIRLHTAISKLAEARLERSAAIVTAYDEGFSIRQIARVTRLSAARVHQLLRTADKQHNSPDLDTWRDLG